MNIVKDLAAWVRATHPLVINITEAKLAELHAHWAEKGLPPVMTFMGVPLTVVVKVER